MTKTGQKVTEKEFHNYFKDKKFKVNNNKYHSRYKIDNNFCGLIIHEPNPEKSQYFLKRE